MEDEQQCPTFPSTAWSLVGRLTRDPELRALPSGTCVAACGSRATPAGRTPTASTTSVPTSSMSASSGQAESVGVPAPGQSRRGRWAARVARVGDHREQKRQAVSVVARHRAVPRRPGRAPRTPRIWFRRQERELVGVGAGAGGRARLLGAPRRSMSRRECAGRSHRALGGVSCTGLGGPQAPAAGRGHSAWVPRRPTAVECKFSCKEPRECPSTPSHRQKSYEPVTYAVGREKIAEYARAVGETDPLSPRRGGGPRGGLRRRGGAADVRGRLQRPARSGRLIFDPEIELNFAMMVHGGQEFVWGTPVVAGDEITTTRQREGHLRSATAAATTCSSRSPTTSAASRSAARPGPTSSGECEADGQSSRPASAIPELRVTPDKYLTVRYAGASGDFNPIHIDEEFARAVGLPGPHPARPVDDGPGRPRADRGGRRPRAPQAAVGPVPRHGRARAGGASSPAPSARSPTGARSIDTVAEQAGKQIIRNAEAELEL